MNAVAQISNESEQVMTLSIYSQKRFCGRCDSKVRLCILSGFPAPSRLTAVQKHMMSGRLAAWFWHSGYHCRGVWATYNLALAQATAKELGLAIQKLSSPILLSIFNRELARERSKSDASS